MNNEGKVLSALLDAKPDEYVIDRSKMWLAKNPIGDNERVVKRIQEKLTRLVQSDLFSNS